MSLKEARSKFNELRAKLARRREFSREREVWDALIEVLDVTDDLVREQSALLVEYVDTRCEVGEEE